MINSSGHIASYSNRASHRLDGMTILRFAHAYDTGGGVELHLRDLNRELGRRNRLTTILLHLTSDKGSLKETEETVGNSRLIRVPLFVADRPSPGHGGASTGKATRTNFSLEAMLNRIIPTQTLNKLFVRSVLYRRKVPMRAGQPWNAGAKAAEIFRRFKVDLTVLHASGGADASEIIRAAKFANVPVALIHHFSNDRLGGISLRQQTVSIDAVGGASWVGVPAYLKKRFWNLSDAVDLDFYDKRKASPVPIHFTLPVIYAPGRITPEKGQMDVVKVASLLARRGFPTTVVFAGRIESPDFEAQLREAAKHENLSDRIVFLGQISLEQYRNWFGAAHVTLMPTYHHEGMPRTLIDSQAMKVPPIVYDIGGTKEGLKDRETGFLIELGNINAVAQATEVLLRDSARHARMADAGRTFVENQFSLQAFASRHEDFYLAALKRQAQG